MAQTEQLTPRESREAFALNVANGGISTFSDALMDANLVLLWFASQLTQSNILLGLIAPINTGGWYLPQIFISGWLQKFPRQIIIYRWLTIVRVATWLSLAAALWWIREPTALLVAFYLIYFAGRVTSGLAGIPFLEVTVKTIAPHQRGRMFALRQLSAGLLALAGVQIIGPILSGGLSFPRNYALLIFISAIVGGLALVIFSLTKEPPGPTRAVNSLSNQLRRGWNYLKNDATYRNMVLGRSFLFLGMIVIPFYSLQAQRTLQAPAQAATDYLTIVTFFRLIANYPWGWIADRRGHRWILCGAALGWGLLAILALGLDLLSSRLFAPGFPFPAYMAAYPIFALVGLLSPMEAISGQTLLMEIIPADDRTLAIGFANTVFGVTLILSGLCGGLVDLFGMSALFIAAILINALAFMFFKKVKLGKN